jgi:thiol-disulfide isomerase/thioredoxin
MPRMAWLDFSAQHDAKLKRVAEDGERSPHFFRLDAIKYPMPKFYTALFSIFSALVSALAASVILSASAIAEDIDAVPAPEFTQADADDWLNSPPLKLTELRGQVLMLHVWAFECWNCYRSFPWQNDVEARYAPKGLRVIGVHAPEFDHEKDAERVRAKMQEFKLDHPMMLDNDFHYWRALGNRYWPAYYLIDKQGLIRATYVGETHAGDTRAMAIEKKLQELLAEPAARS